MRRIRSFLGLAACAGAFLAGCGGEARDATSKELASLTAEISKLRAQQASLEERLGVIERAKARPSAVISAVDAATESPAATSAPRSLDGDRPSLDVVRLGPSADPQAEADEGDEDDGPRTVLRSGANGIVVEETGPGGASRVTAADAGAAAKKPAAKKSDPPSRKKNGTGPTP